MKICVYVLSENAKQNYSRESYNVRQNAGMAVVVDILRRQGYEVEFASKANVHRYDIVLVSITSDCDWWPFLAERIKWQKGDYKIIAGGAGVLNVRPFLPYIDYFVLGRAEGVIDKLVDGSYDGNSVVESKTFSPSQDYYINQVDEPYPYEITLENGKSYCEGAIGCPYKCKFCSYTWHRKQAGKKEFRYDDLWNKNEDVELALLDINKGIKVNYNKLRTTAIDGMSERLRFAVNKRITSEMFKNFLYSLATCEKPHQVKLYNVIGYPGETEKDWWELVKDIREVDRQLPKTDRQTSILLHSTPFRAMPATPMACASMRYENYRGAVAQTIGRSYKGNIFYQGNSIWAVESMGTESLATVAESVIILRGTEIDTDTIAKISAYQKYWKASMAKKIATLEKYFDMDKLFTEYTPDDLPTRYVKTHNKT